MTAKRLIAELVAGEQLTVRRTEKVASDLATWMSGLGRTPRASELEAWLEEHAQVEEVFASRTLLDELLERYFTSQKPDANAAVRSPELERTLYDDDSADAYLVYADWLLERGDRLGELIALGVAATVDGTRESRERFEKFRTANEQVFLPNLEKDFGSSVELRWKHGLIEKIGERFEPLGAGRWQKLFALRVALMVRAIDLRLHRDPEVEDLILQHAPALRALGLHYCDVIPTRICASERIVELDLASEHVELGTWLPPKLERLELTMREVTRAPGLTALPIRELQIHRSYWQGAPSLRGLDDVALPELASLDLGLLETEAAETYRWLEVARLPALRRLVIRGQRVTATELARVAKALPQLARLELASLAIDDRALEALAALRLDYLDVSGNELSAAGIARAKQLAGTVVADQQHAPGARATATINRFAGGRLQASEAIVASDDWSELSLSTDPRRARYRGTAGDYELSVARDLSDYTCTCPSAYQPCKHVVALALIALRSAR